MYKSLVALVIFGATNVPAAAQPAPATNAAQPATPQTAKPQTVKKRVCEMIDEDSYSRLGNRKICKTIEVPAEQQGNSANGQTPAQTNATGNNM
jgi:hypothetical protein